MKQAKPAITIKEGQGPIVLKDGSQIAATVTNAGNTIHVEAGPGFKLTAANISLTLERE